MAFDNKKIKDLFSGNDNYYKIPRFQRRYVWEERNWLQLFNDVMNVVADKKWNHFIGTIVFNGENTTIEIIDGQQRMISLQLFIAAIISKLNDIKMSESDEERARTENICKILSDYITVIDVDSGAKPRIDVDYDNKYKELILCTANNNPYQSKDKEKSLIIKCYLYFKKNLEALKKNELLEIYKAISNIEYVGVEIKSVENAYTVYETLNARGTSLLQIELIKNYLFHILKPDNGIDTYKIQWGQFEENIDKTIKADDYLFHVYKCLYEKHIKLSEIYEKIKDQIHDDLTSAKELFANLIDLLEDYKKVVHCDFEDQDLVFAFRYFEIKNAKMMRSLLLSLVFKNREGIIKDNELKKIVILLRDFYIPFNLKRSMSNSIDSEIHRLSYEIMKLKRSTDIKKKIYQFIINNKVVFEDIDLGSLRYSNKKNDKNIMSKPLIYLFEMLFSYNDKNYEYIGKYDNWTIEHVINDSKNNKYDAMVGNLFPCPKKLNGSFKSKDYNQKRRLYDQSQYGWIIKFAKAHKKFDDKDIEKRTKELSEEFKKIITPDFNNINKALSK